MMRKTCLCLAAAALLLTATLVQAAPVRLSSNHGEDYGIAR